jgi:hypothetical protein
MNFVIGDLTDVNVVKSVITENTDGVLSIGRRYGWRIAYFYWSKRCKRKCINCFDQFKCGTRMC